jgi:transposase
VFSAVCPQTGDATGLITPNVNTDAMNSFLEQFARELPRDVHAAVVLDRAGWHVASALRVPTNVTLVLLPPKSPELNPAENLWHYLRAATTGPTGSTRRGRTSSKPQPRPGGRCASCPNWSSRSAPTRRCARIR